MYVCVTLTCCSANKRAPAVFVAKEKQKTIKKIHQRNYVFGISEKRNFFCSGTIFHCCWSNTDLPITPLTLRRCCHNGLCHWRLDKFSIVLTISFFTFQVLLIKHACTWAAAAFRATRSFTPTRPASPRCRLLIVFLIKSVFIFFIYLLPLPLNNFLPTLPSFRLLFAIFGCCNKF